MADPTHVNSQITDAVTQANLTTLGQAPAMAIGALSQSMTTSLSLLYMNATQAQQNMSTVAQAATTQGVASIYSVDTAADAVGIAKILEADGSPAPKGAKNGA